MRNCLLLLTLLLASCSKQAEEARSLVHKIPASSVRAALQMAESAQVKCADPTACPESVGLFAGASSASLSTCTAFLVAEDMIATNSHCIPSAVKLMPDLCPERVRMILPQSGEHLEESFACEALLFQSERPNEISPDLALLRVKKTSRTPLSPSGAGVKPNAFYTAYKMNPGLGASGTIVAQNCFSVPDTYRFPLYHNEADSIFVTGDCPSVSGNSGAPLVSAGGLAVGIFQAELALDDLQKQEWSPYLKAGEEFAPLALGTSLACLQNGQLADRCVPIDPEEISRPNIQDFLGEMQPQISTMAGALDHEIFGWKATVSRRRLLETEYILAPACFKPLENWIGNYLITASEPLFAAEAQVSVQLPRIRAAMQFNRYMQVSLSTRFENWETRELNFHPQQLFESGTDQGIGLCSATEAK